MKISSIWRFVAALFVLGVVILLIIFAVLHFTQNKDSGAKTAVKHGTTSQQQQTKKSDTSTSHPSQPSKTTTDKPTASTPPSTSTTPKTAAGTDKTTVRNSDNLAHTGPGGVIAVVATATVAGWAGAQLYQTKKSEQRGIRAS